MVEQDTIYHKEFIHYGNPFRYTIKKKTDDDNLSQLAEESKLDLY